MSRRSVREYVFSQLSGISGITAFKNTPKGMPLTDAAIIQRMMSQEKRESMPRGGGRKRVEHDVYTLIIATDPDEDVANSTLDDNIQKIIMHLRAISLPVTITDSVSGEVSTILYIGEEIDITFTQENQLQTTVGSEAVDYVSVNMAMDVTELVIG